MLLTECMSETKAMVIQATQVDLRQPILLNCGGSHDRLYDNLDLCN